MTSHWGGKMLRSADPGHRLGELAVHGTVGMLENISLPSSDEFKLGEIN